MIHVLDPDTTFKLSYVTFYILCVIFEAIGSRYIIESSYVLHYESI
jgi:hypothetical protein